MYIYCLECGWKISTDNGYTEQEASETAIEHFVETGHAVESLRLPPPVALESSG
ncbi:hypothetical protein [Natrarchaeobius chitinivorans]|uniref:hypothetical protein n=1 Tax=Natrarchaeobius chitinivorans TaxID=1679083 RepID=UPI001404C274|nr:hypothetical protein [Natrarchaeobius chitinivorans]